MAKFDQGIGAGVQRGDPVGGNDNGRLLALGGFQQGGNHEVAVVGGIDAVLGIALERGFGFGDQFVELRQGLGSLPALQQRHGGFHPAAHIIGHVVGDGAFRLRRRV